MVQMQLQQLREVQDLEELAGIIILVFFFEFIYVCFHN